MQHKPNQALTGLPGTRGFPLVGDVLHMLPDPLPYLTTLHARYGNVFYTHFAWNRRSVFLLGPEATEQVLISQADKFSNELGYADLSKYLGERAILFQDGAAHRRLRKAFNPAFKTDNLRPHISTMIGIIDAQLTEWAPSSTSVVSDVHLMTLRIASQSIVGADVGREADAINRDFLQVLSAVMSMLPNLPGSPKWQGKRARTQLDKFFRSRIAQRRSQPGSDVFSQLCAAGLELSDDEIVDNMVGVLFAAYETTASTLLVMLYALACNPYWQDRLREELAVLNRTESNVVDAMQQCVQTDWVFKEALRLYAPLSFLPRRTLETVEVDGFTIPANTSITIAPRFVHHLSAIYSEPDRFDPDRFSPARSEDQVHRCAWVPFGKGGHACIGMHFARIEVYIFFARLLKQFRIEQADGALELNYVPVLKPKRRIPIHLAAL